MDARDAYLGPLVEATKRLKRVQGRNKGIAAIEMEEMISTRPHAAVFRGTLKDKRVAVKLFLEDPQTNAQAAADELTYLADFMGKGAFRVPKLIAVYPGAGVTVTEFVDGNRMDAVLGGADAKARRAAVEKASAFLWHLSGPRRRRDAFGGRYWLRRAARYADQVPHGPARKLGLRVVEALKTQHADLTGKDILKARSHGDFSPVNLIETKKALFGIDIQNAHWLPLSKDAARFLVYCQAAHPLEDGPLWHGLSEADVEPFRQELAALAQDRFFVFFVGVEYLDKLSRRHGNTDRAVRLSTAMEHYLSSLSI